MKVDQLEALGFHIVAGQIDRGGKNYGFLAPTGPVLTPDGEELVLALQAEHKPAVKSAPAKKAKDKPAEAPEAPTAPDLGDLEDILG